MATRARPRAGVTNRLEPPREHCHRSRAACVTAVPRIRRMPATRVAALPTVAPSVLPRVLRAYRTARPGAELRVITGRNALLLDALRARELDAVIGRMAEPDEMVGLTFELLFSEPLVMVARAGHALARAKRLNAAAIGEQPLVLPLAGTIIRHSADSFLRAHGVVPHGGLTE